MQKKSLLFFLFLSIAFWVSENNQRTDDWCRDRHFEEYQEGVLDHSMYGPIPYRLLIPYSVDFLSNTCHVDSEKMIIFYLNIILLLLTQFAFYYFLRNFFTDPLSILGVLWLDLTIMMGFTSFIGVHVYETTDLCNLLFMTCALHLLFNRRWLMLYVILFTSMLNRETPIFMLIPVYILLYRRKISIQNAVLCSLAVLVPYFGLKLFIHPTDQSWFLTVYMNENIPFYQEGFLQIVLIGYLRLILLMGCAIWLAIINLKRKNEFLRVTFMILPFYFLIHLFVGHVEEYRIWVPLFLFLIPLALETINSWIDSNSRKAI